MQIAPSARRVALVATFVAASFAGASSTDAQAPAGYYDSADPSSATTLRATLHAIIDDHTRFPYSSDSTDTWDILELADEDPSDAGAILDVYKNASYPKAGGGNPNYDREHLWPNSYGISNDVVSNYPYTDCFALRLCDSGYNSARGNKPFRVCAPTCLEEPTTVNGGQGGGVGTYPGNSNWTAGSNTAGTWEVWGARRGDVARALLYLDVRYEGGTHGVTGFAEPDLILTDSEALIAASNTGSNEPVAYMGMLSVLLQWHALDPVDASELARSDVVFSFQGNRNPFVDHPEWVAVVFGGSADPVLATDVPSIDLGFGGTQSFSLAAGIANAGLIHYLVGSASGTAPGLPGPPPLPLNFDSYFLYTLLNPNALILNSLGFLDGAGNSSASLTLPPGMDPGLAGATLHHAYVVLEIPGSGHTVGVSNPVSLDLVLAGGPGLVINEVDYDQPSIDTTEFIELRNNGAVPVDLTNVVLDLINGSNGTLYGSYSLSAAGPGLAPGAYLVLGSSTVVAALPPGTPSITFPSASDNVQNGAPDGIVLRDGATVLDSLSYEGTMTGVTEGVGGAGTDSPTGTQSLSRLPDGSDTNDNAADFQVATSTPGAANHL